MIGLYGETSAADALRVRTQGFPFDDFDLHDVMLPEDEGDFGYPSDDDVIDEEEIVTETGFGSVIGERLPHAPLV